MSAQVCSDCWPAIGCVATAAAAMGRRRAAGAAEAAALLPACAVARCQCKGNDRGRGCQVRAQCITWGRPAQCVLVVDVLRSNRVGGDEGMPVLRTPIVHAPLTAVACVCRARLPDVALEAPKDLHLTVWGEGPFNLWVVQMAECMPCALNPPAQSSSRGCAAPLPPPTWVLPPPALQWPNYSQ